MRWKKLYLEKQGAKYIGVEKGLDGKSYLRYLIPYEEKVAYVHEFGIEQEQRKISIELSEKEALIVLEAIGSARWFLKCPHQKGTSDVLRKIGESLYSMMWYFYRSDNGR